MAARDAMKPAWKPAVHGEQRCNSSSNDAGRQEEPDSTGAESSTTDCLAEVSSPSSLKEPSKKTLGEGSLSSAMPKNECVSLPVPFTTSVERLRRPGRCGRYMQDQWASARIFAAMVLTYETLTAVLTGIAAIFIYYYAGYTVSRDYNISLISVAIIFPLTMSISQAFQRREVALNSISSYRAWASCIFAAHMYWDWPSPDGSSPNGGRRLLPPEHTHEMRRLLDAIMRKSQAYCELPVAGLARHAFSCGSAEAAALEAALNDHIKSVARGCARLHSATEVLKTAGLPSAEASRLSQYVQKLMVEWETIRTVKEYRTPHSLRGFARVFIVLLPFVLAPTVVYDITDGRTPEEMLEEFGGGVTAARIVMAIIYTSLVSVVLSGLLSVEEELNDPFYARSLESVKTRYELHQTREHFRLYEQLDAEMDAGVGLYALEPAVQAAARPLGVDASPMSKRDHLLAAVGAGRESSERTQNERIMDESILRSDGRTKGVVGAWQLSRRSRERDRLQRRREDFFVRWRAAAEARRGAAYSSQARR